MSREFKYRVPGVIFYLFFIFSLILTSEVTSYFTEWFSTQNHQDEINNLILPIIAIGVAFVTSEGIGYFFVTIAYACFNLTGGYGKWYKQKRILFPDLPKELERFSSETLFIFTHWYRKEGLVDTKLDDWVTRRFSVYFTNISTIVAIITAIICSGLLILFSPLEITLGVIVTWVIALILITTLFINSRTAKKEAMGMIELFFLNLYEKEVQSFCDAQINLESHRIRKESEEKTF